MHCLESFLISQWHHIRFWMSVFWESQSTIALWEYLNWLKFWFRSCASAVIQILRIRLLGLVSIVTYILICFTPQTKSLHILPSLQEKQLQLFQLLNSGSEEEITLLEAMKLLMFLSAVELYQRNVAGDEVPVFVWLMYARDTSETPAQLLRNHINKCGDSGGLEQVSILKNIN